MTLPKIASDHETVDIGGGLFDVRTLTRAEQARFQKMVEADTAKDELEICLIAVVTDTPEDEVRDWYARTPGWAVEELMEHITRISRIGEGAQKRSGTSHSAGGG